MNINYNGKNIAVIGENRETTIIDGDSSASVVTIEFVDSTAMFSGFSLINGAGGATHSDGMQTIACGGGMLLYNASPAISNVTISNNNVIYNGGGIYMQNSEPNITNVTISNNTARDGGGFYSVNFNPTLTNVRIINNTASRDGGGMCLMIANPTLTNVTISNNTASDEGGGIYCGNS